MPLRQFFYLTKSDRRVFLVILTLVVVALIAYTYAGPQDEALPATPDATKSTSAGNRPHTTGRTYHYAQPERPAERFAFDPNTADSTQLLRLGLQPWQVLSIYRYRARGGVFRRPEDFARLYGLTKGQYESLRPYIQIGEAYQPAARFYGNTRATTQQQSPHDSPAPAYPQKLRAGEHVDLNEADTTALKRVPGIGSYYAREIVYYRRRLGGYANANQLKEIEGFPESALPYFHVEPAAITRLNLNTLTLNELRRHPYLNFYQARDINDYRRLKGRLRNIDDLRLLPGFTPATIERLRPYVSF